MDPESGEEERPGRPGDLGVFGVELELEPGLLMVVSRNGKLSMND